MKKFTDYELALIRKELSAAAEFSEQIVEDAASEEEKARLNKRANALQSILNKIADEQQRRSGRGRPPSGVSAMDLLMQKINADRSASHG